MSIAVLRFCTADLQVGGQADVNVGIEALLHPIRRTWTSAADLEVRRTRRV
jgi:hypothetical protein